MPDTETHAPFLVEHRREALAAGRDFAPAARLVLTPALRTSGLWGELPPEELRDLLLLLTFLAPNGWFRPALPELAAAMRVSEGRARDRMDRLARRNWRGGPLTVDVSSPGGLSAYAPGRQLLAHEEVASGEDAGQPPLRTAGRVAVLAYSRARYARTRAEVEREIEERMGWGPPAFDGDEPGTADRKRAAFTAMTDLGMAKDQALGLLARFDLDRIGRQVAWLGSRNAKNPARYLAAAVEHDYDAPPGARTDGKDGPAREAPRG